MKDPTIGIGTNQFASMKTKALIALHIKVCDWQEELDNRAWEDGQGWDIEQIDNDRNYIHELFKPELEAELNKRAAARRGKS